jgi:golgin subfamily B member 1
VRVPGIEETMAELTVANYLAALQDDPWDQSAMQGLNEALASGDPRRTGDDPVRLLEYARRNHEVRGENLAAAKLMAVEVSLVATDPDFAAVLWRELGRVRRDELMDDEGAREAYQHALKLRPGDEEVEQALEQLDQVSKRWQEISKHFVDQAEEASDPTLRTSLLLRAASIIWQYKKKGRNKEVDRLFQEALLTDPASARGARLYELTLREREKWSELAEVLLGVAEQTEGKDDRLGLFLDAARVFAHHLNDRERAAACFERVLELAPAHEEALGFLVAHFTEHEQWDHLVAVYEDALRARQLGHEAEQGMLLQIAMVQWRMLQRADRAEPYFARVRKADPGQPVMLDYYRERYGASGEANKLLAVLSDAQRRAEGEGEKARFGLEIARLAKDDAGSTERAIDAFKLVLRHEPHHAEAVGALKELYRRSGRWNALVELLRGELDALPQEENKQRLLLLKEMLVIYRDELKLESTVLSTYNTILQLEPADKEASNELAKTYEQMGRWNELIAVLSREAESELDTDRKLALLLRVAQLWIEHFSNYNQATAPLEQVLAIDAGHREALSRLREIYTKKRAWQKLFEVLSKEEQLSEDPAQKRVLLLELASLAGERLHDYPEGIRLYRRLLEVEPRTPGALDALEKLAERAKDWDTLTEVLEQRAATMDEFSAKTKMLMRIGTLHAERTQNPKLAAAAWKRVLELDPKNGRALRTLREAYLAASDFASVEALYAEVGDWEGYVDVLGSAADRTTDPEHKKALSFRAAEVYEQQLKEPARAFRAYERVLSVEPDNERAVRALLPIYEKDDKWPRVAQLNEALLAKRPLDATDARRELCLRLVDVYQLKLRDGERAFARAADAYAISDDDDGDRAAGPGEKKSVRARLESACELAGAHDRLCQIYLSRAEVAQPDEALRLRRRVAQVFAERLRRPELAARQLELVLTQQPNDEEAQRSLERIYRTTGSAAELRALYTKRLETSQSDEKRAVLLGERAKVEEELLADLDAATESYRALAALRPEERAVWATLDRLLSLKGKQQELASVLDTRLSLSDDKKERVELSLRLAKFADSELHDRERAVSALAQVLESEPNEPRAVELLELIAETHPQEAARIGLLLEPVYERTAKLDKLARVLKRRLESASDGAEKRSLKLRLAEIEGTLGDPRSAYQTLESAFLDNPQNSDLWDRITNIAEKAGALEELAVAFSTAVEMAQLAPAEDVELSARTARLYDEVLAQSERAEPFYKRVLAHDPSSEEAYEGLRELYTTRERWDELKQLYSQRIEHTLDPQLRLELLLQVCFLYEEILDDVEQAIASYEAVLQLDPGQTTSRRALERLYARAGRHRDLVSLLETERQGSEGKEAIELSYAIGELYELKLNEPQNAVDQYAAVLDEQPTHLRAQEALSRLVGERSQRQRVAGLLAPIYAAQGAYAELAKILEVQLEQLPEPGARTDVLMRLGQIRERELRDVPAAYDAYARAVDADPTDQAARSELARVAQAANKVRERATLLESVLARVSETRVRSEILIELAQIWDSLLPDRERALDAYTRLIDVDPHDGEQVLPAARALERLHLELGDHAKLAEDLRQQITFERDAADKARLLTRLAELHELKLGDLPRAIEAYVERLDLEPNDAGTLLALEGLYQTRRDFPRLISILQRRDTNASNQDEARELARRVGEIYERELNDRDAAIAAYHDVLGRFGNDRATLVALARVYDAAGRKQDLLETLTLELELVSEPKERAEVRFRAAELMRLSTHAPDAALEAYRTVLDESPGHGGALAALQALIDAGGPLRVEAARVLAPHQQSAGDYPALIATLEVLAESDDARECVESLRRASETAETQLAELPRAYALMARAAEASLQGDDLPSVLAELDRLARKAGAFLAYVEQLSALTPKISDEQLALQLYLRSAEVSRADLGDADLARDFYERALALRSDHAPALDALEVLHEQAGDFRSLLKVVAQKTELAGDAGTRTRLLLRQAELSAQKLDDVPHAIEAYERLLDEAPSVVVFSGIEPLYQRAERWRDLAALYERQLELNIGDGSQTRFKLAELNRTRLRDPERALDLYRAVLEKSPTHDGARSALEAWLDDRDFRPRAAELLEPLYLRTERWAELTRALEAQVEAAEIPERKKELLTRLAQLHEVQLEDLETALDTYARLFRVDPADAHTLEALTRLSRVLGKQSRLAEILEGQLEDVGVHDELGVRLSVLAAQIRDQHDHDLEKATTLYNRALAYDPGSRLLANAVEDLLLRRKAHEELRTFYRSQADLETDGQERLRTLRKLAVLHETELSDVEAAIRSHQEVIEISPRDSDATLALDRLLADANRWTDLADHLRHQIDGASGTGVEVDLKLRLARLFETRLDDIDRALDTYEEIAQLAPDNSEARGALERLSARPELLRRVAGILEPLYAQANEWKKEIWLAEKLVAAESVSSERADLFRRIAQLHEGNGREPAAALSVYRRALVSDPSDQEARSEIERLAEQLGDWNALVAAFEEAAQATSESALKASLLGSVARTHDEKRGDPRAAIHAYERLVQTDTDDPAAFDSLEGLLTMVGDWTGLVNLFKRKVERSYDARERAELWRRAGSVLDELIGDEAQSIRAYNAALQEQDDDGASLAALDDLYTRTGDTVALSEVLKRRAELVNDVAERVDVNLRLGSLLHEKLGQSLNAIDAFTRVLEDDPTRLDALVALGNLFAGESRWAELLDNQRRQFELAAEPAARLSLLYAMGQVHDERLAEFEEAIECYREALAIDPGHEPSIRALMRIGEQSEQRARIEEILEPILRSGSRWDDLATVLSRAVVGVNDAVERQQRLLRLAEIHERGRNDLAAAFDAVCEALVQDADEPRLPDELERLASALSTWDRAVEVLALRAAKVADPELARDLYRRMAVISERELKDLPRAIEYYEQALARGGDEPAILAELDRLYAGSGRHEALADVLERRVAVSQDGDAIDLLLRLGELRQQRFADPRSALNAYRDVLDRAPGDARVTEKLEALLAERTLAPEIVELLESAYRSNNDVAKVANLYEARLGLAESSHDRARLLSELALLYENELADKSKAAETLRRAFEADPSDFGVLDEVERVAHAARRFDVLAGLVETATQGDGLPRSDRRDLWMRAAAWYRDRLFDVARSEAALRQAIQIDPDYEPAHDALVSMLRGEGRHPDLVEALFNWAERESDRVIAIERFTEAAIIAETAAGQLERALAGYERVLSLDPGQLGALDALIRIHEAGGRLGKVVQLYERRIEAEQDTIARVALRHRAARLRSEQLDDSEGAIRLELANLDDDPGSLQAMEALEKLYEQTERYPELVKLLARRLEVADGVSERTRVRVRLALVAEQQLGDRARAIAELREIVSEEPAHIEANQALERLLAQEQRWGELVDQLERRVDLARDAGDGPGELKLLLQLGELVEERLADRTRAASFYERAVERDAGNVDALRSLARLYLLAGDGERAAAQLESLLALLTGTEKVDAAYALAEIAERELQDGERAEAALRTALEVGERAQESRERLLALYERSGAHDKLAQLLVAEAERSAEVTQKVAYLRRAAELYRDKLADPANAALHLERASQLAPDDRNVLIPLSDLYLSSGREVEAIPALQKVVASFAGRRSKELAVHHRNLARAYRHGGDVDRALAELEAAYKVDLTNVAVLADLGILAYEQGDLERAQKTFRGLLLQKLDRDAPISKADVYFFLGEISRQQGDKAKAISMLERALAEQPTHQRARAVLTSLKA